MYTMKNIIDSLPKEKNKGDSFWIKYVARKISFLSTYAFINLGFTAWTVSIISVFVVMTGCVLLSINNDISRILGVILVELWMILDCTDGNIARVTKTCSYTGEFVDALSGHYTSAFIYLATGVAAFHTTTLVGDDYRYVLLIVGAIASISNILTRLVHQKYIVTVFYCNENVLVKDVMPQNTGMGKKGFQFLRTRVDKELGLPGLFMPWLIVSLIFRTFEFMIVFYMLLSLAALIVMSTFYSLKVYKMAVKKS